MTRPSSQSAEGPYEIGGGHYYRSKRNEPILFVAERKPYEFKMYDGPPAITETACRRLIFKPCGGVQPDADGFYHYKFSGEYA